ncbi:necrosis inducing protein [Colletotrichum cereale]|nr:necrosis inducing protein [Colletotrichum cereale]
MITSTFLTAWCVLWATATAAPTGQATKRQVRTPTKINECVPDEDKKWQPAMDYDTDSCYNSPAIDQYGKLNYGMDVCYAWTTEGYCRDEWDLDNMNVYSRARCNNGWCAYMYAYYFEKDQISLCLGHQHDWEHVVVFVQDGVPKFVSISVHGQYERRKWEDIYKQGTHPRIVYHKDGMSSHALRFAKPKDAIPENHWNSLILGDLVGWNGFPSTAIRDKMTTHSWGDKAKMDFTDLRFKGALGRAIDAQGAKPRGVIKMDTAVDDGSPGMPKHCPNHFWPIHD